MFKWGIKQPVKTKNEANTMLVTQAFSQDAKILACVPLSPISGGVQSPPLIEGSLYPVLTGCKTPISKQQVKSKCLRGGQTVCKNPNGETTNQWG